MDLELFLFYFHAANLVQVVVVHYLPGLLDGLQEPNALQNLVVALMETVLPIEGKAVLLRELLEAVEDDRAVAQDRIQRRHLLMAVIRLDCVLIQLVAHLLLELQQVRDRLDTHQNDLLLLVSNQNTCFLESELKVFNEVVEQAGTHVGIELLLQLWHVRFRLDERLLKYELALLLLGHLLPDL